MGESDNGLKDAGRITQGSYRKTGTPGRRILVLASWRSEDRALRAMVTRLRELVPCSFEILNLDSPTAVRYRDSSRALFQRIRRYDAAVFVFPARDGAASPILSAPSERLPLSRLLLKRTPAAYIVGGAAGPDLEDAIHAHAQSWHLFPLGIVSDEDGSDGLESLARTFQAPAKHGIQEQ